MKFKKIQNKYHVAAIQQMQKHGFVPYGPLILDNKIHRIHRYVDGKLIHAWYIAQPDYGIAGSLIVSFGTGEEGTSGQYYSHINELQEIEERQLIRLQYL